MTIRNRLTFLFSSIVAATMLIFCVLIHLVSERNRQVEFSTTLKEKALYTANFVIDLDEINPEVLKKYSTKNTNVLENQSVMVYDNDDKMHPIIYRSGEMNVPSIDQYFYKFDAKKERSVKLDDDSEIVGVLFKYGSKNYVSVAKAYDHYGILYHKNLGKNLLIGWFLSVFVVVLLGWYYSKKALQPINDVINQVEKIGFTNLDQRVKAGEDDDEIATLANTFNGMLSRLKKSFEAQKSFVSNASHELRTPLTAMNGQIEVALMKDRNNEEYKQTLFSIKDDITEMTALSNGLLDLASIESGLAKIHFEEVRIDEILWEAQSDLTKKQPNAKVSIAFGEIPDEEDDFMINANEQLLKTAVFNLMENGCKFSKDQKVEVILSFIKDKIKISFTNFGAVIPSEDLPHLFIPFYRSESTKKVKGHGIGLPLTQKIVLLHNGNITVESTEKTGTTFTLIIKR